MKSREFEVLMRSYERYDDPVVMPGLWTVARLDGRNFSRLTKMDLPLEKPHDARFHDAMVYVMSLLMTNNFEVDFAYTQSDEISLLFRLAAGFFGRRKQKWLSILPAFASVHMTARLGDLLGLKTTIPALFDCRLIQFPNREAVVDYFRWRQSDATRNSLNDLVHWKLLSTGMRALEVNMLTNGMTTAEKHERLHSEFGINFNDLPVWERRGVVARWKHVTKASTTNMDAVAPGVELQVTQTKRELDIDNNIPFGDEYGTYVRNSTRMVEADAHALRFQPEPVDIV